MSRTNQQEETPLLLLFLEDDLSPRPKHFNNSRFNRISEGASAVFTQWPGQVTICCIAAFVFLIFFLTFVMISLASTFPLPYVPHCTMVNYLEQDKRIYLVHHGKWYNKQVRMIEDVISNYPNMSIELIDFHSAEPFSPEQKTNVTVPKRNAQLTHHSRAKHVAAKIKKSTNITSRYHRKSYNDNFLIRLIRRYPFINYRAESMNDYFSHTMLRDIWNGLNIDMIEFAARVIPIWENGGINFKLPGKQYNEHLPILRNGSISISEYTKFRQLRVERIMDMNITSFEHLPVDVVSIDEECNHMETKTPCHSFFGDLLLNIHKSNYNTTTKEVIYTTLKTVCRHAAAKHDFCAEL